MNRWLILLAASMLARAGFSLGSSPEEILRKTFADRRDQISVVIQKLRLNSDGPDSIVSQKIETDGRGRQRRTIISPLFMQGTISFDDAKTLTTYDNNSKQIWIQDSPYRFRMAADLRIAMAKKNYSLTMRDNEKLLGRRCYKITAKPESDAMPTRTIWIDSETSTVLKTVLQPQHGEAVTLVETLEAKFPKKLEESIATPPEESKKWVIKRLKRPQKITDPEKAEKVCGFTPLLPNRLPEGFNVVGAHMYEEEPSPMIAVRITDGLAVATVYQFEGPSSALGSTGSNMEVRTEDGVRIRIVGELPNSVGRRILSTFQRAEGRSTSRVGEPAAEAGALKKLERIPQNRGGRQS